MLKQGRLTTLNRQIPFEFNQIYDFPSYEIRNFFMKAANMYPDRIIIGPEINNLNRDSLLRFVHEVDKRKYFSPQDIQLIFQAVLEDRGEKMNIEIDNGATAPPRTWTPLHSTFERDLCSLKQRKNMTWDDLRRYMLNGSQFTPAMLTEVGPQVFKDLWSILPKYVFIPYDLTPNRKWSVQEWCQQTFDLLQENPIDDELFHFLIEQIIKRKYPEPVYEGKKKKSSSPRQKDTRQYPQNITIPLLNFNLKRAMEQTSSLFEHEYIPRALGPFDHVEREMVAVKDSSFPYVAILSSSSTNYHVYRMIGRNPQKQWALIGHSMNEIQMKELLEYISRTKLYMLPSEITNVGETLQDFIDTSMLNN